MKERVRRLLANQPQTRADDRALVVLFWNLEQPMLFAFRKAESVLRAYAAGELTNPADIVRTKRQVQKERPDLRATSHKTGRHD